jgi:hypothetical protein
MTSSSSSSSPGANDAGDLPSSCTRPDLLAFQIVSFLNLSYLGLNGMHAFFVTRRPRLALPKTPQGRILQRGSLHEADVINSAIVVFQGWDFVMSCMFVEHRVIVMLVHHFLAFVCGYFSLMYEVRFMRIGTGSVSFLSFRGAFFFLLWVRGDVKEWRYACDDREPRTWMCCRPWSMHP